MKDETSRHKMLGEAIDIIRLLWQGGFQSYRGEYLELEDARVYDIPDPPPEIIVGISGPASARLAAEKADGVIAMESKAELPNPVNFDAATTSVRPDDMAQIAACGPEPEQHVQHIQQYVDAGFENLVLVAIGPGQDALFGFRQQELQPRLH